MDLCKECHERPVKYRGKGLCNSCYERMFRSRRVRNGKPAYKPFTRRPVRAAYQPPELPVPPLPERCASCPPQDRRPVHPDNPWGLCLKHAGIKQRMLDDYQRSFYVDWETGVRAYAEELTRFPHYG